MELLVNSAASAPLEESARATHAVAIATSAGGLSALETLLANFALDVRAAILIVQHLDRHRPSLLSQILTRGCALPVREAIEGEMILNGRVYVAPPDFHLMVTSDGKVSLSSSKLVQYVRPSADMLFESVANSYKTRAIGVILTGTGHDGTDGARAIKQMGGVVIAQDEASSEFFGMPGSAIRTGEVDYVLPLTEIGFAIRRVILDES